MRTDLLVGYVHRDGVVHRLPAPAKLLAAVGVVVGVVLLPRGSFAVYAGLAAALLSVAALARLPLARVGLRLLLLEPFAVGVALMALFSRGGLRLFADTVARSTVCLLAMILLTATTRVSAVLGALLRLGVPRLLVTTLAFTHRYLFVLSDEMGRMRRARRSRTFSSGRRVAWAADATIAGQVFVRASERAERVAAAMAARGWK